MIHKNKCFVRNSGLANMLPVLMCMVGATQLVDEGCLVIWKTELKIF